MLDLNKTHCGNNIELIREIPDGSIDLTVTSPPYDDMDLDFNPISKDGLRDYDGYAWDFRTLAGELFRVTKAGGVVSWIVDNPMIDQSESLASALQKIYFRRVGFRIHDTMVYQKNGPANPSNNRYHQVFEYMFILVKGDLATFNPIKDRRNFWNDNSWGEFRTNRQKDGTLKSSRKNPSGKYGARFNVWEYLAGHPFRGGDGLQHKHPASFPEALARDLINSWSNPGELILDPFMGGGTVGKMAIETGRRFIGFEISEKFTALANQRVQGANLPLLLFEEAQE